MVGMMVLVIAGPGRLRSMLVAMIVRGRCFAGRLMGGRALTDHRAIEGERQRQ
jgi:hypothetical protein